MFRRNLITTIAAAALAAAVPVLTAADYPSKPIRFIVATAPGGGTDFVARLMGHKLAEALGQQVIVDNRPGAGSTLGYELGVRAAPDGYTFTMITPSYAINPSLYSLRFDPLNDFTPVIPVARGPYVVVVHPSLPVKTVQELMALAKAGRLRALAVTTPERIAAEPDLPTVAESGVPGYEVTNWHGLIGPKGVPQAIVERLNSEMTKIIKLREMEDRLQADGMSPAGGTPEQLYEQIRKEIEQWRQVVARAGIRIN